MICITCGTQFSPPGKCPECEWDTDATHNAEALAHPGEVLAARYSIQKSLGSGRFGFCFKASDYKFNTDVVLKFIHPAYLPTPPHFKRFTDGMEELKNNSHSLSATLLDVGQLNGHVYVSYEYVDGGSLAELLNFRLKTHQPFALSEIYPILKEAAASLIETPIAVHGAICPKNIFIQSGSIKVLDAGLIANLPEAIVGYRLASTSKRRRYVAPEIIAGDGPSTRSDVYSLGVILMEMLTLKRYDIDENSMREIIHNALPDSPAVEDVLYKAFAAKKKDRYKDVEIFLHALAEAGSLPMPHFQRIWAADENSMIEDVSHVQEDKTAQIIMKDVIQQHYEEVTSVGRNPLFGDTSSAPPVPKPSSQEPPPHKDPSDNLPKKPSGVALPKPGGSSTLPKPNTSWDSHLPRPSAAPLPHPSPSSSSEKESNQLVPPRPSLSFPKPPEATEKEPSSAEKLPNEESDVFDLDDYELTPPEETNETISSVDVDDLQLEELSEITPLSEFDEEDSPSPTSDNTHLPEQDQETNDVHPRFLRAAKALDEKTQPTAEATENEERDLDGINPRFLRAAKKLATNAEPAANSEARSPFDRNEDDWRDRIEHETSNNDKSVISFLAPPANEPDAAPQPPIATPSPPVPKVPSVTPPGPRANLIAPPPPPPPAKKP